MKTIEARTLKGFRDFLPAAARRRQFVIRTITEVYESFGFVPLETPALEYGDVLAGKYGDEGEKLMYKFADQGGREVALRYDLTVPLARVVAQYPELPKPFRRYQIAPVWRAENTQKGRFREFTQSDIDIVGTTSLLADAEIAQAIGTVLARLGFDDFVVRFNNRKLLNGLLTIAGIPEERFLVVLRILDKWLKIGEEGVRKELADAITPEQCEKLLSLIPNKDEEFFSWSKRMSPTIIQNPIAKEGWLELNQLVEVFSTSDAPDVFQPDILLARGLDYYTGTILEASLKNKPELGSVFGGGRYDKLIGMFTGSDIPAVGASAGVDRLVVAMEELGMGEGRAATADVLVALMDKELIAETGEIATELRDAGIKTELAYDAGKLDKQFKYADKQGIPFVVLYGSKEKDEGMVTVKTLATKEQQQIPREDLVESIKGKLKA